MAVAILGEVAVSLFVAGAAFGEVQVPRFVAGAAFGDVQVSFFVAGAVFAEVELSLFVAGAVFREIWNDSRSAKCCMFQYKMLVVGVKSNLGCEAGCGLTVSWSDRPRNGNDVSSVFSKLLCDFGRSFFVAGAVFGEVRP